MDETSSSEAIKVDYEWVKNVVIDLAKKDKRELAFDLLETYYKKASTLADFDSLGYAALKVDHRKLYLKCAESAYTIAHTPEQIYIARSNLYKAYNALNYPEKALFYVNLNLEITPDDFDTNTQRAVNLSLMGRREEADQILLDLAKKFPEKQSDMRGIMSGMMLRSGRTAQGIIDFVSPVKKKSHLFEDVLKMTRWNGIVQPGRTIYVEGEGGTGDEFINIRFFKHLRDLGMKPILYSAFTDYRADTVDIYRRHGFEVITEHYSIDTSALWTQLMILPGQLGVTEKTLWYGPYLTPKRDPKNTLPSNSFKIGIKCNGNPYFAQDEYRSIPLEDILAIMPPGAEVYYMDKDKTQPGTKTLDIKNWDDTLDYIDQMDCIVSSCTSLVHAAGAMGKTTFVAVPIAEYYIWTTSEQSTRSPWYGENFYVHRQTVVRSWKEPLASIGQELVKLMNKKLYE